MATIVITLDKLETNAFLNIFDLINNRSNINDPRATGTSNSRKFIHTSDPFAKSIDFDDFPYLILELPMIEYSNQSANGRHKIITWRQGIIVRTAREGASNFNDETGRIDMLNICDDLNETFNSQTNKSAYGVLNMYKLDLTKTSTDTIVSNQKEIFESVFALTYMTRFQTSS